MRVSAFLVSLAVPGLQSLGPRAENIALADDANSWATGVVAELRGGTTRPALPSLPSLPYPWGAEMITRMRERTATLSAFAASNPTLAHAGASRAEVLYLFSGMDLPTSLGFFPSASALHHVASLGDKLAAAGGGARGAQRVARRLHL